jgi:hypothetical protein
MSTMALLSCVPSSATKEGGVSDQLLNRLVPASFNLLKQEIFKTNTLFGGSSSPKEVPEVAGQNKSLGQVLKLNKAILEFFDNAGPQSIIQEQLYQDSQIRELVTVVVEQYFLNKNPLILSFEKFKKNLKISKMI